MVDEWVRSGYGSNKESWYCMPKGQHSGVRVAMSVPPGLHKQLSWWAEMEGRPVASLCLAVIEGGLRQAQKDGIAPSIMQVINEGDHPLEDLAKEWSEEVRRQFGEVMEEGNLTIKEAWFTLQEKLRDRISQDQMTMLQNVIGGFMDITAAELLNMRRQFGDEQLVRDALRSMRSDELSYMENIIDRGKVLTDKEIDAGRVMKLKERVTAASETLEENQQQLISALSPKQLRAKEKWEKEYRQQNALHPEMELLNKVKNQ